MKDIKEQYEELGELSVQIDTNVRNQVGMFERWVREGEDKPLALPQNHLPNIIVRPLFLLVAWQDVSTETF